jgi:phospholipid transport system substrate-binding protein
MVRARALSGILAGLLVLALATAGSAGVPTDQLRGAVERAIKILEEPSLKGGSKTAERRDALRKVANDIFDWTEIGRRALGPHWRPRTDKEREEFIQLFGDLLERAYMSKIELYGGEKIAYTGERVEGDVASVTSRLVTKSGTEIPIDYRMVKRGERWLVYDVSIEGVSLVGNYRTQFNKIIQTAGYPELVRKLKTRQEDVAADGGAAGQPNKK